MAIGKPGAELLTIMDALVSAMQTEQHLSATPGNPSSPPIPPALASYLLQQTLLAIIKG